MIKLYLECNSVKSERSSSFGTRLEGRTTRIQLVKFYFSRHFSSFQEKSKESENGWMDGKRKVEKVVEIRRADEVECMAVVGW